MKYEIERKESKMWVNALKVEKNLRFSPYLRSMWEKEIIKGLDKKVQDVKVVETDIWYIVFINIDENCSVQDINELCQIVETLTDQFMQYYTNLLKFVKENWEV